MSTIKKAVNVVEKFVVLKYRAWVIDAEVRQLREAFYEAAEKEGELFLVEPAELGGAIANVAPVDRKAWDYPEEIKVLELKLKAKKEAFEAKNEPLTTDRSWRVSFSPYRLGSK